MEFCDFSFSPSFLFCPRDSQVWSLDLITAFLGSVITPSSFSSDVWVREVLTQSCPPDLITFYWLICWILFDSLNFFHSTISFFFFFLLKNLSFLAEFVLHVADFLIHKLLLFLTILPLSHLWAWLSSPGPGMRTLLYPSRLYVRGWAFLIFTNKILKSSCSSILLISVSLDSVVGALLEESHFCAGLCCVGSVVWFVRVALCVIWGSDGQLTLAGESPVPPRQGQTDCCTATNLSKVQNGLALITAR